MASDRQLALSRSLYGYQSSSAGNKPSALLNSIFMSTVNTAAKTLVSVASKSGGTGRQVEKWKPSDHLRFMVMMTTWLTVWVLRVLMDHLPFSSSFDSSSSAYSSPFALSSFVNQQQGFGLGMLNQLGSFHELLASSSSSVLSTAMSVFSPASSAASAAAGGCLDSSSSLDLVLSDGSDDVASVKALGRALTNFDCFQPLLCTAILIGEMGRPSLEDGIPDEVKFRVLALWIPLFCYAENGLSYPVLSGFEKAEMERIMNELITSLPSLDQEVILTNWLQDFTSTSSSDWPNLQVAYDKWCHSTRNLVG
ncbi:OLC1v1033275C1 [Oldenlandia corymbosa var. corymbosa]|uniref:OLC1v1033275C1 n=1 Tax=Oldenlandia corymbosa var. corymbosa TaxID=529605 RepID=A0AAV1CNS7_OLDCO|nr:OLC1v1033275C1 [Oldenlandia corymbosa var. corymbosa]